ncbi:two-component system response regulator PhoP [Chitinivorax tropicus]|uniref:Two-component system response regulator PhoP n=1 Tax=Chitinivorax tropicus TaxID=714531 RepID=A0A840MPI2_9PROT|nr:response regulator transcription factor [Chitinivorax tropicus]MBB5018396.1 two-component system response regulator PhoP [Chitinivorax tropicus]
MKVLIVEDEPLLREFLTKQLSQEGFVVESAADGEDGLYLAGEFPFDAAIIDLGLPKLSGIELIKRVRAAGKTLPILVLTARNRWQEKVEGLDAGADDYLTKPFDFPELLARVRALLRRSAGTVQSSRIEFGPLALDWSAQKVWRDGAELELTTFEYRMLEYLVKHRDKVVAKDELGDYLYPHDEERDSNVIEVIIGRLRKKLDPEGKLLPIETLRGRGYRFALT